MVVVLVGISIGFIGGKEAMSEEKQGYRAFPPQIEHPSQARRISEVEFKAIDKVKMQEAPSITPGHKKTIVWYSSSKRTYLIEIQLDNKPNIYAYSLCTATPTHGMDKIDGEFAQDIEVYLLFQALAVPSERLSIVNGKISIDTKDYLKARGYIKE